MKIKKAFLIYPPTGIYMRDDRCQAPVKGLTAQPLRTPLDLAYMAATLENLDVVCKIKDYPAQGSKWSDFKKDLKEFDPDMLIISITTPTMASDLAACEITKAFKKDILTVSKGAHYLAKDEEALRSYRDLDIAIRGECEFTISEIASSEDLNDILGITYRKDGRILKTADRPYLDDLDKLPFPARHLLNNNLYLTPDTKEPLTLIYTGRGCPHKCIFCAVGHVSGHKIKLRSPESIVREIEECVKKYKIKNFFFRADTFTWDEAWVMRICRLIIDRNIRIRWGTNSRVDTISDERLEWMKKAGCWIIGFGVESGNQQSLDLMRKKSRLQDAVEAVSLCKKYGIKTYTLFIIGLPWEDTRRIKDTLKFSRTLNGDYIDINIAYPLPGTELFQMAKDEGLFSDGQLHGYDYSRPLVRTRHLSTAALIRMRRQGLLRFYLRPNYIAKTLLSVRSARVLLSYIKAGLSLVPSLFNKGSNVGDFREEI